MLLSSLRYLFVLIILLPFSVAAKDATHFVFASAQFLGITTERNGKPHGLAIALLDKMSKEFDFTYEVQYLPWKRALQMAEKNKVDGVIGAYYSDERAGFLIYGNEPIYQDEFVLMSLKSSSFEWSGNLQQLHGKSFSLLRSASYGDWYDEIKNELDIAVVSTSMQQFELLKVERVDLIVNNQRTSPVNIRKLNLENKIRFHKPALTVREGYFTASKQSNLVPYLAKFDKYMALLSASGEMEQLRNQFLTSN